MTNSELERVGAGAQLKAFSRTLSLGNWPFLALLVFVGVLVATPLALDGRWVPALLLAGAIAIVPSAVGLFQLGAEYFGLRTLAAIHENGIVWRRLTATGFVPWKEIHSVTARPLEDEAIPIYVYDINLVTPGQKPILIDETTGGEESAEHVRHHLAAPAAERGAASGAELREG